MRLVNHSNTRSEVEISEGTRGRVATLCTPCTLILSRPHTSTWYGSEAFGVCGRIVQFFRGCGGDIVQTSKVRL